MGSNGLNGCSELTKSDHIHIFFTKNAKNVGWDVVKDIVTHPGEAEWEIHEVPSGKQSADIHLSSYLGYLIGINKEKECVYVIVSRDKDFDPVIEFWIGKEKAAVSRIETLKPDRKADEAAPKKAPSRRRTGRKAQQPTAEPESEGTDKKEFGQKIRLALQKANYSQTDIDEVVRLVSDCYDAEHPECLKSSVHNALQKEYDTAQEIYHNIETVLKAYSSAAPSGDGGGGSDRTSLNNVIQQILSKAKMSADVIGFVTSTVVQNIGEKNGKQQIYRNIISKFGQKKGLDIYNRIKKHIS